MQVVQILIPTCSLSSHQAGTLIFTLKNSFPITRYFTYWPFSGLQNFLVLIQLQTPLISSSISPQPATSIISIKKALSVPQYLASFKVCHLHSCSLYGLRTPCIGYFPRESRADSILIRPSLCMQLSPWDVLVLPINCIIYYNAIKSG